MCESQRWPKHEGVSTGHFRKTLVRLLVNGEEHTVAVPVQRTLLEALRYELGLTGSKQGCDKGDCGACTVLARPRGASGRGEPILSCITLAQDAQDLAITTIEGLAGPQGLDAIQRAFADCGALQCGCTGYTKIYEAVEVAAGIREPASRLPIRSEPAPASDQVAHEVKEIAP